MILLLLLISLFSLGLCKWYVSMNISYNTYKNVRFSAILSGITLLLVLYTLFSKNNIVIDLVATILLVNLIAQTQIAYTLRSSTKVLILYGIFCAFNIFMLCCVFKKSIGFSKVVEL